MKKIFISLALVCIFYPLQAQGADVCIWYDAYHNKVSATIHCKRPFKGNQWFVWTKCTTKNPAPCKKALAQCGGKKNKKCKLNPLPKNIW